MLAFDMIGCNMENQKMRVLRLSEKSPVEGDCEPIYVGSIDELAEMCLASSNRLLLPPIQRSVVWSNEQVVNYWDSLLRGYPSGMMMVHRVQTGEMDASSKGRDAMGTTCEAKEGDFHLFDGQQRMAAILLGLGKGQMQHSRKLWVDFGKEPEKSSGLNFQLRMTSSGQPFGYRPEAPNQRIELRKRQDKWKEWLSGDRKPVPQQAFEETKGSDIIDAACAVAFSEIHDLLRRLGQQGTIDDLANRPGAIRDLVEEFVSALDKALKVNVILQQVDSEIVANQEEYIRFFGRLGQGGTRLSDDELTYSIIKHQYPEIHDRMKEIMQGEAGRLAGEVDLVLATLRVAKTLAPWNGAKEWEVIGRPGPNFVSQLEDQDKEEVRSKFLEMIPLNERTGMLIMALEQVREALSYDASTHPEGLPAILLGHLPRELVDVLILFAVKMNGVKGWPNQHRAILRAFALHWLLFVGNDAKAAWRAFQKTSDSEWVLTEAFLRELIGEYENDGVARFIPRREVLSRLREEIQNGDHHLRPWAERFTAADHDGEHKPGEALRVLSTNRELIKRALMWLQRAYISEQFPYCDPTSDRDDDLPIDLDHIVPYDVFGFDWRYCDRRLKQDGVIDNFRWQRGTVGNSLGNFRWLAASDNRSRGKGAYVPLENGADLVPNPDDWNRIIPDDTNEQNWSADDIATFQRLIDLRTLDLYEKLMDESDFANILP